MEDEHYADCAGLCYECDHFSYCDLSPDTKYNGLSDFEKSRTKSIYLASSLSKESRDDMYQILAELRQLGHNVYAPVEHTIENAWDYPNQEWGRLVFEEDIRAIKAADIIVAISHGRTRTTSGASWEIGYAYGIGKKVLVVEMDEGPQSLMVSNGSHATVKGVDGLLGYDFSSMPKVVTDSEQK